MRSFRKNVKTPIFLNFWPKRPILGHFWLKRGHFRIFGEKAKNSFFTNLFLFFNTKNQKILMRGFSGKWARTYVQTDVRTEANPKVHRLRRETKNQTISVNQSKEKWEKPHFQAFLRGLRGIRGD